MWNSIIFKQSSVIKYKKQKRKSSFEELKKNL